MFMETTVCNYCGEKLNEDNRVVVHSKDTKEPIFCLCDGCKNVSVVELNNDGLWEI